MWVINLWFVVAAVVGLYSGYLASSPMHGARVAAKVAFFPFVIAFAFVMGALSFSR